MSHTDDMPFTPEEVDQQIERYLSGARSTPQEQAAQRALQRLQRAYLVKSDEHAPSLERVWQRVLAYEAQESAPGDAAVHAQERANDEQEATRQGDLALPVRPNRQRRDRGRAHRPLTLFAQLAAVFILALIVGSYVLVTTLSHRGQPPSSFVASPTTVRGKPVALQTIHMFDASVGWAITYDHNRILHTTAGVTHWQDVSPGFDTPTSIITGTDFFAPSTAWVAVATGNLLFMYRTNDGGHTWQKAQLPDQGLGRYQIVFLNEQVGWVLVGKGTATGSEAVDVLHTSDGGANWKVISVSNYNTANNPAAIPFGGDKSGLSFVSATTGWITGFTAANHVAWLYITHDGGVTWQHQPIPLPNDASQVSTLPPIFFNANDGVLPVVLPGSQSQALNIYVTHDGGASWSTTTPIPSGAMAGMFDFVDATHGWVASNTYDTSNQYKNSTIYHTSDGGQHWMHYTIKLNADITEIDFVSQTQGWAIDSTQTLYQTTNGGQTWAKVTPTAA